MRPSREAFNGAGLSVDLDRVVYIREFIEPGHHHCEPFIIFRSFSGILAMVSIACKGMDEQLTKDVQFLPRDEASRLTMHPKILKNESRHDVEKGSPTLWYMGVSETGRKTVS